MLGIYAGLVGVEHGIFEILQGNTQPDGVLIHAIGQDCQPEAIWHGCFPAMTVLPSFLFSGILAVLVGLAVVVWATGFVQRKHGGFVLIILSLLMLPIGGGFVPVYIGVLGGVAGSKAYSHKSLWRRINPRIRRYISEWWLWMVVLLIMWFPISWILGYFFSQAMLSLGTLLFLVFDLVLPLLIVVSGTALDS